MGSPLERSPEAVCTDVIRNLVSVEKAKDEYGVILTSCEKVEGSSSIYAVDHEATMAQREKMKATTHKDKPLFNFGFKTNIKNWSSSSGNKGNGNKDPTGGAKNPTGA